MKTDDFVRPHVKKRTADTYLFVKNSKKPKMAREEPDSEEPGDVPVEHDVPAGGYFTPPLYLQRYVIMRDIIPVREIIYIHA